MGRYPLQQWQSGSVVAPYGPLNGARLNIHDNWLDTIFNDFDAHVGSTGDVHPQYVLSPSQKNLQGPLYWMSSGWVSAKLTNLQIADNAAIKKSQLEPLAITNTDVAANAGIQKSKLDLAGQIGPADLAPGLSLIPAGAIIDFGGDNAPNGWVLCDGSTYDGTNTTYLALWNAIQNKYGGTGQSAFKVPDYRGRVSVMKGSHADNNAIGKEDGLVLTSRTTRHVHSHTLTLPNHVHAYSDPGHVHPTSVPAGGGSSGPAGGSPPMQAGNTGLAYTGITMGGITTAPAINGQIGPAGNFGTDGPSYLVSNRIIKL